MYTFRLLIVAVSYLVAYLIADWYGIAFMLGVTLMDTMWAWRLGIPQSMYQNWKNRKNKEYQDHSDL